MKFFIVLLTVFLVACGYNQSISNKIGELDRQIKAEWVEYQTTGGKLSCEYHMGDTMVLVDTTAFKYRMPKEKLTEMKTPEGEIILLVDEDRLEFSASLPAADNINDKAVILKNCMPIKARVLNTQKAKLM